MLNAWMTRTPEANNARITEIVSVLVRAVDTEARVAADPRSTPFQTRQAHSRVTRAHAAVINAQALAAERK